MRCQFSFAPLIDPFSGFAHGLTGSVPEEVRQDCPCFILLAFLGQAFDVRLDGLTLGQAAGIKASPDCDHRPQASGIRNQGPLAFHGFLFKYQVVQGVKDRGETSLPVAAGQLFGDFVDSDIKRQIGRGQRKAKPRPDTVQEMGKSVGRSDDLSAVGEADALAGCLLSLGGLKSRWQGSFRKPVLSPKHPVSLQLPAEILVYRIGVGSPEKLVAAHLNDERRPDTHKTAGFRPIADKPSYGDPPFKIPQGSLPRSSHRM